MVFVYSCYVVIPLMNSIRFSYAQRRIPLSLGQDIEQGSARYDPDDLFHTTNDSIKREFLDDMQHAERHREVTRFAALCFCMELVSFLDVFQAFKSCVYREMLASISQPLSSTPLVDSADSGAISELQSIAKSASTQSTSHRLAGVRSINSKDLTAHSSVPRAAASPRTSVVLGGRNLAQAIFNRDSLKTVLWSRRKAPSQPNKQGADAIPQTSANLQSLATGIAKTMAQAFPDQGIGGYTEFSESLRESLCALINTFILPESPLALNVTSNIVSAAHLYLGGGSITYSIVDQVAREAINSLYFNVYVRYHQLRG
ncbi:hypothetical protein GGI24_005808 [Coemansia furcata]|nr:hypothetical protein GGI24_005808 [Coemansia furcata]